MIKIYTIAVNRPDFIELQHKTFKHFLKDEYQLIVVNDGFKKVRGNNDAERIDAIARELSLESHRVPFFGTPNRRTGRLEESHPSHRHANSIRFLQKGDLNRHNDIAVIIDGDMFLSVDFSIREFLNGAPMAGAWQSKNKNGKNIEYVWPGVVFLDVPKMFVFSRLIN